MPRNGTGQFIAPASSWNPGVNGVTAQTADFNALLDDLEAGLTQSVSSDGQTAMTGNLPLGNNKITGLAAGVATTDAANVSQTSGRLLNIQIFTSNATYNPTTGTQSVLVEVQGGGGGGGGGVGPNNASFAAMSQAGAGGTYARGRFTSGFAGAAITIGAGGTGGPAGNNAGSAGGASSFGALLSCPGGPGGFGAAAGSTPVVMGGGNTSLSATGSRIFDKLGQAGGYNVAISGNVGYPAQGGSSFLGGGGQSAAGLAGSNGNGYGGGGSGVFVPGNYTLGLNGGSGTGGVVIVWEFA